MSDSRVWTANTCEVFTIVFELLGFLRDTSTQRGSGWRQTVPKYPHITRFTADGAAGVLREGGPSRRETIAKLAAH